MKKFLYIILGALTLSLAGCKGFLDEENLASTSSDAYYRTAAGHQASVNVAYSYLRDVHDNAHLFLAGTDLHILYNSRGAPERGLAQYANLATNHGEVTEIYDDLYKGVGAANTALHYGPLTEQYAALPQMMAEARFLRAFYYMNLVQQFGGTPLITEMHETPVYELERPSDVDIWNFVITEMEAALPSLIARATGDNYGRVDQRACRHFLALAYLNRAWKGGGNADFTQAKSYADQVIAASNPLIASWAQAYAAGHLATGPDVWRNDEVIWCVTYHQSSLSNTTNGGSNQGSHFSGYFNGAPQMNKQTSAQLSPTQYFMWLNTKDIADPNNDSRWDASFEMVVFNTTFAPYEKSDADLRNNTNVNGVYIPWWKPEYTRWATREDFADEYPGTRKSYPEAASMNSGFATKDAQGKYSGGRFRHFPNANIDFNTATIEQLKVANTLILRDQDPEQANGLAKEPANVESNFFLPNCIKFDAFPDQKNNLNGSSSYRDIDLGRVAETYLIAAEASFKLGNSAAAADYINTVRRRAIAATDAKREMAAADVSIERILDERARELFGMYVRWYDLSRTGTLVEHASRYNPDLDGDAGYFDGNGGQRLLRPIPQNAIDGNRADILQNPGY